MTQHRTIRISPARRSIARGLALVAGLLRGWACCFAKRVDDKRVVVLEPFGMGDVLSLEPMLRALHQNQYKVTVCARGIWKPLIPDPFTEAWIDAAIPWNHYALNRKYAPAAWWDSSFRMCLRALRRRASGAVGIDPRGDIRSIILLYLAGCKHVYTLSHYLGSDLAVPRLAARIVTVPADRPRWKVNLQLLGGFIADFQAQNRCAPSVEHLAGNHAPIPGTVALVPVTPWAGKSWATERWCRLVTCLAESGLSVRILCGPGQTELARAAVPSPDLPVQECPSVAAWVKSLGAAESVISMNTGPMHVADALKKPLVVIHGSSHLPLWAPSGPYSAVVHGQDQAPCAPCHQTGRVTCDLKCLRTVTHEKVCAAFNDVRLRTGLPPLRDSQESPAP